MAYRGESKNIFVGAAELYVADGELDPIQGGATAPLLEYPAFAAQDNYRTVLNPLDTGETQANIRNVGYTNDGLELMFEPDFGEVTVDQILDVAKLFKQGMKVSLKTSFAEATLENLLIALAYKPEQLTTPTDGQLDLNLSAGELGECPVERGLIAVGPGTGDCAIGATAERVYVAYRALSIESVTSSMKRDESSAFEVSFRLLPEGGGSYGRIVDRQWIAA